MWDLFLFLLPRQPQDTFMKQGKHGVGNVVRSLPPAKTYLTTYPERSDLIPEAGPQDSVSDWHVCAPEGTDTGLLSLCGKQRSEIKSSRVQGRISSQRTEHPGPQRVLPEGWPLRSASRTNQRRPSSPAPDESMALGRKKPFLLKHDFSHRFCPENPSPAPFAQVSVAGPTFLPAL